MDVLLPTFKIVSVVFAISAVVTGLQAIINPIGFSRTFGLPLITTTIEPSELLTDQDSALTSRATTVLHSQRNLTKSYISLMGIRQLATGIILLTFALQRKWIEMATILAIIGIVVAGTDGIYLSRAGAKSLGWLHAIPGAAIAVLASGVVYSEG